MVGFRGDLVHQSLDSGGSISPLVACIGVWLAVTLAVCCSPRGWSRLGAENSNKGKPWQRGTHRKLHNCSYARGANTKLQGNLPLVICYYNEDSILARSFAQWRYGIPNVA